MGRIYTPISNPLTFYQMNPVEIPQYLHRHMDDYLLSNRLTRRQSKKYYQPWTANDSINLQFQNNAGNIQLRLVNCQMTPIITLNMTQKQQNKYMPDYFIYESSMALTGVAPGIYWVIAVVGSSLTLISEPIEIGPWEESLIIEYKNRTYLNYIIYETGFYPSIRLEGLLRYKQPGSNDTLYEDQVLDMTMVKSKPFRIYELIIGHMGGIPDYKIDQLNQIMGCSDIKIDGRYFTKNGEQKFEKSDPIDNGSHHAYRLELRESINRNAKIFDTVADPSEKLSVMYVTDSKGFGNISDEDSSNLIPVIDFE